MSVINTVQLESNLGVCKSIDLGGARSSQLATSEEFQAGKTPLSCVAVPIDMNALGPPVEVRDFVKNWEPMGGFTRISLGAEYSFMDDWGVRIVFTDNDQEKKAFICLAGSDCRMGAKGRNLVLLSGGKTASAVRHLKRWHHLV
ncbi:unnamed protein product [Phytophthora fragariaefolia]|uniref:Unnamed protein product n=1 Tax=Phytophthora fragariaefolia TaxID=1490495 RepID=A0A9W6WX96_9STRA|nr:unnamed protein product [Phytophthora fragariaefolia]